MTVRVGVIGVGMIGQDHIRRLTTVLAGSQVVAVTDVDADRARQVAEALPAAARSHGTGQEVITDDDVDAVIVTSWGPTHEEYVLAALEAGKPVFCEKPLATTSEACSRIVDAEVAGGRRLVQVGYMRRYDAAYQAMKAVVDSGDIGAPLMLHSTHRNPEVPGHYTREMAITDTAVHDFDTARWLLGEEYVAATVLTPRRSRHGGELQDPLLILLETESGVLVDVETSVNIRYGYDIRGEVVGEDGTVSLADSNPVVVRRGGVFSGRVPEDWRERFLRAYDVELQAWVDVVASGGGATGPSSWDGYAAAVVSDAAVQALHSGTRTAVQMRPKPDLYAKEQ
ncbi:MAG TPA: Gfo/Idh/MocA family oxidoreductase [Jiangellales bacterium]|nr:Gfo/Idh/MocA family oxidoreductase [Jiangellales bacterium]